MHGIDYFIHVKINADNINYIRDDTLKELGLQLKEGESKFILLDYEVDVMENLDSGEGNLPNYEVSLCITKLDDILPEMVEFRDHLGAQLFTYIAQKISYVLQTNVIFETVTEVGDVPSLKFADGFPAQYNKEHLKYILDSNPSITDVINKIHFNT